MGPALKLPDWSLSAAAYLVISGFPLFLLITWFLVRKSTRKHAKDADKPAVALGKWDYALYGLAALAVTTIAIRWAVPATPENIGGISTAQIVETAETDMALQQQAGSATTPEDSTQQAVNPSASAQGNIAIAVMPLDDLSATQDQEYFSDGISEEIIYTLSRIDELDVTAHTSSFAFKGENVSSAEIGQRLGVSHIVSGAVRKQGDQVRITIQLTDTTDNITL